MGIIPLTISDSNIFNNEQARQRVNYEMYLHSNMCETVDVSCIPLHFLDVNKLIEFNKPEINLSGKFLIDTISESLIPNR